MAGIVNTALRKSVRTSTVFGLGVSAVSDEGLGILHKLPIREGGNRVGNNMNFYTGKLNVDDVHCIDLTTGNLVRLRGQDAAELSLDRFLKDDFAWELPGLPMRLSELGLALEQRSGHALDIEWASKDGKEVHLVQARPISKIHIIARTDIRSIKIIFVTEDVAGLGEKEFSHAILIRSDYGNPSHEEMSRLRAKYPNSFVVYVARITKKVTRSQIYERILPYTDTLLIKDLEMSHISGTGLQHVMLESEELGKMLLFISHQESLEDLTRNGTVVETMTDIEPTEKRIEVYQFDSPVKVAADDEHDWGMVYTS